MIKSIIGLCVRTLVPGLAKRKQDRIINEITRVFVKRKRKPMTAAQRKAAGQRLAAARAVKASKRRLK